MTVEIRVGDALALLRLMPGESVHCCVTSPPYFGLRDYGVAGQMGLEDSPDAFVAAMVEVFREVRRVLRPDGTCWLNIGDSYAGSWGAQGKRVTPQQEGWKNSITNQPKMRRTGSRDRFGGAKPKDLLLIPFRLALALQADGWWVRSDIIWAKPAPMPESAADRPTCAHEHVFLLTKAERYFYDGEAIKEPSVVPGWEAQGAVFGGVNKHAAGGEVGRIGDALRPRPGGRRRKPTGRMNGARARARSPPGGIPARAIIEAWSGAIRRRGSRSRLAASVGRVRPIPVAMRRAGP